MEHFMKNATTYYVSSPIVGQNWHRTNITSIPPITQREANPTENIVMDNLVGIFSGITFLVIFYFCARYQGDGEANALFQNIADEEKPEQRQKLIERSLFAKRIVGCDQDGNLTLGDVPEENIDVEAGETQLWSDDEFTENEETSDCCIICLETFQIGDIVAWPKNSNKECLHVWHSKCIMSWLQNEKHDECPNCRCAILKDSNLDDSQVLVSGAQCKGQSVKTPFIIINGLISNAQRMSCSFMSDNGIPKEELQVPLTFRRVFSSGSVDYRHCRTWTGIGKRNSICTERHNMKELTASGNQNLSQPLEFRRVISDELVGQRSHNDIGGKAMGVVL